MKSLTRVLVRSQFLTEEQAEEIDAIVANPALALEAAGFDDIAVASCLSEALAIPSVDIAFVSDDVRDLLDPEFVSYKLCVPLQLQGTRRLLLGMVDPTDMDAVDAVRFTTNLDVVPRVLSLSAFRRLTGIDPQETTPIARLVNLILVDAIKMQREVTVVENDPDEGLSVTDQYYDEPVPWVLGDAMTKRLRVMANVPEGPGFGGIILMTGGETPFFFIVEFSVDDRRSIINLVTRADFEDEFGIVEDL